MTDPQYRPGPPPGPRLLPESPPTGARPVGSETRRIDGSPASRSDAGFNPPHTGPDVGSPRTAPASPPPPAKVRGHAAPWLVAGLVTIVVAASSFMFGRLSADPPSDTVAIAPVSTVAVQSTTPEAAPSTTVAPSTTAAPPQAQEPLVVEGDSLEPAAAVAAAVGPAVVQLEVGVGVGSGVIYDGDGLILTAAHVVQGSSAVTVRLANGLRVPGDVVGIHLPTDVAVVKIDGGPELPVALLGVDAEPVVGQTAIALGSPFGLDQTVTAGIISAVNREVNGVGMVQTDAAINPGNSGGPLVDRHGRVIGINDAIRTLSGANDGVGFAIPIDLALIVAEQLITGEPVQLARLGVTTTPFNEGAVGALITDVTPGSAAAAAGLQVGDLITSVDGSPIADSLDLRGEILTEYPGTDIELSIVRNDEPLTVTATLGAEEFSN